MLKELAPFAAMEHGMEILRTMQWSRNRYADAAELSEEMTRNKMSFTQRMRFYDDIRTGRKWGEMPGTAASPKGADKGFVNSGSRAN